MVQQHGFSCRGNAGRLMAIARLRQSGLQQVVILSIASSGTWTILSPLAPTTVRFVHICSELSHCKIGPQYISECHMKTVLKICEGINSWNCDKKRFFPYSKYAATRNWPWNCRSTETGMFFSCLFSQWGIIHILYIYIHIIRKQVRCYIASVPTLSGMMGCQELPEMCGSWFHMSFWVL